MWGYKKCSEGGFTLPEVLIVTAIVAIISVIAIPSVNVLNNRWELDKTVRILVAELGLLQQTAVATGKTCRVDFYTQSDAYRLFMPGEQRFVRLPEGISIASNNFPVTGGGYRTLSFNRNGAPNRAGTVSLVNERGDRLYIIVYLATGRIRISEEPPENW